MTTIVSCVGYLVLIIISHVTVMLPHAVPTSFKAIEANSTTINLVYLHQILSCATIKAC